MSSDQLFRQKSDAFAARELQEEPWRVDAEGIDREAALLVKRAEEACPAVESRLKFLSDTNGGHMVGLEFKIKQQASLVRKMKALWTAPSQTLAEIVEAQY